MLFFSNLCISLSRHLDTEKTFFSLLVEIQDSTGGLVVRVSDYWLWGSRFDSRFYHGEFSLKGKIPMVTGLGSLVELRFKAPPGTSYITIHLIGTT
jgi:hypothetical protein